MTEGDERQQFDELRRMIWRHTVAAYSPLECWQLARRVVDRARGPMLGMHSEISHILREVLVDVEVHPLRDGRVLIKPPRDVRHDEQPLWIK